jgi:4-diphosphocytidyl-2-C-methyl-D-erythritol kinase
LAEHAVNDFERSVFRRHPRLGEIRNEIVSEGAAVARLTGSGAALYGVFPGRAAAESAAEALAVGREDVRFEVVEALASQPEPEPRM